MNQKQYLAMKLKAAEATIQRVRDLHQPVARHRQSAGNCRANHGVSTSGNVCFACRDGRVECHECDTPYPCPTIQTLGDQK